MKIATKVLRLFLVLGICCAMVIGWQRYKVETANTKVESIMEYGALVRIAESDGVPVTQVMKEFKDRGVTTLAVFDATIDKLKDSGQLTVFTGSELLRANVLGTLDPQWKAVVNDKNFNPSALYLAKGTSDSVLNDVEEDLKLRLGSQRVKELKADGKVLCVYGDIYNNYRALPLNVQTSVNEIPLGILSEDLKTIKDNGFMVAVRPEDYTLPYCSTSAPAKEQVEAFFKRLDKSGADISMFLGSGDAVLGKNAEMPYVAQELVKRHITLGMMESVIQLQFIQLEGLTDLAKEMNYQVARTYFIDRVEQKRMQVFDAFRRWAISNRERDIRANYIQAFHRPRNGQTLLQTNLNYVSDVNNSVKLEGFTIGKAGIYDVYHPNKLLLIPLAFAVMSIVFSYLGLLCDFFEKRKLAFTIICGAAASGLMMVSRFNFPVRQGLALCVATVVPALTMYLVVTYWEKHKDEEVSLGYLALRTTGQLILAVCLSLLGATIMAALLSDIRFFLEMDIYRGVKLTFIMPPILAMLLYLKSHRLWDGDDITKNPYQRMCLVMKEPFSLKLLLILMVLGFVAWVFVGRSGHTDGVPVPNIELRLRIFLERALYARPREKEFLIGHPAFYLAALGCVKRWPSVLYGVLIIAATIGQGSLIETFAHMRTPIFMSYIRAFCGLGFGIILGLIGLVVIYQAYPICAKALRRLEKNE